MTALRTADTAPLKFGERSRRAVEQYSEDAEQAVLSAILMEPQALRAVRPLLVPDDFFKRSHGRIYAAQIALADRGIVIDPLTLVDELERRSELDACGGKEFIGFLLDAIPTAANVEYHAKIVLDRAQRRALQANANAASVAAMDPSVDGLTLARDQRDALDAFLAIAESGAIPPAIRASEAQPPKPLVWSIEELWPAGEIGLIVGDGGSFKSTAAVHIAGAIAGGYEVFGHFGVTQAPTLIVSAEDSADVVFMRLRAFVAGHGWDAAEVLENVHVIADPDVTLAEERWRSHVTREALRIGAGFVVVDPWAELIGGDENSNTDTRPIVKYLRALGRETGAGVAVVHHAGKAGGDKRMLDRIRGASALPSASRTILFFEYQQTGVLVTHLKSSRAPRLEPFIATRWIDSAPLNRADWFSARFSFETARTAAVDRGEDFVLTQIKASPRMLTTAALRSAAEGTSVRREDISRALVTLQAAGLVDFEPTARGGKLWFATLPSELGRVENTTLPTLPTLPGSALGRADATHDDPTHPFRGRVGSEPIETGWVGSAESEPSLDLALTIDAPGEVE